MTSTTTIKPSRPVLVTGAAGFIGYHLCWRLLEDGLSVVGLDNMNDYYDVSLKQARLDRLMEYSGFHFARMDIENDAALNDLFQSHRFESVVNLAAQAGVRYSIEKPRAYIDANIIGFFNILEACRHYEVRHLVYASSSSVYGLNTTETFSVKDNVDHPVSLYAASKKSNELMAHAYSHLFRLPTTGLRFFTVYGPWGRPDMALFKFSRAIMLDEPLELYNYGDMWRDFTYIDDIVEGVVKVLTSPPEPDSTWCGDRSSPNSSSAPYRLYNIGHGKPAHLRYFLELIEKEIGKKAIVHEVGMQPGDVPKTWASVDELARDFNYRPQVSLEVGIKNFLEWFIEYYGSQLKT